MASDRHVHVPGIVHRNLADEFEPGRPSWSTSLRIANDPSAREGEWDSLRYGCDRRVDRGRLGIRLMSNEICDVNATVLSPPILSLWR